MAIKDPKARRSRINYPKGSVTGALGLLEYLFGSEDIPNTAEIKVSPVTGKRRLVNVQNRATAVGGKQLYIFTKDGKSYMLHYTGTMVDWRLGGVPLLKKDVVMAWSTARGTKQPVT